MGCLLLCWSAVVRADIVYVVFGGNSNAVEKIDSASGADLGTFASSGLSAANGIAFDASGNVCVSSYGNNTVRKFSPAGADLGVFASTGLTNPGGLAFDSSGNLYVASSGNSTIRKFSPAGTDLGVFASAGLSNPSGLAFDSGGNLYVSNVGTSTVRKLSPAGADLGVFADNNGYAGLNQPIALAFDSAGNLYVANFDSSLSSIRRFSPAGVDLGTFASTSQGLNNPHGLAFDSQGNLFVANYHHDGPIGTGFSTVVKLSATGALLSTFSNPNLRDGSFVAVTNNAGNPLLLPPVQNGSTSMVTLGVSPSSVGTVSGGGTYANGVSITVNATANSGYQFLNWTENGGVVSSSSGYTFTVTANRVLVANFSLTSTPTYTIATSAVAANAGTVSGGGTYTSGANVALVATPATGYAFVNWTENGSQVSNSPSYSFTATANRTLVANFVQTYTIAASSGGAAGTVSGGGTYTSGTNVALVATPATGYVFVNWTENGSQVSNSPSYSFTAIANRTLVANFIQTYTIAASSGGAGGTVSGGGTYTAGANVTLVATSATSYAFVNWTENGNAVSNSPSYSFAAAANRTLVANFVAQPDIIYVAYESSKLIQKFSSDGTDLGVFANTGFDPRGIAFDSSGNLYVADLYGNKIEKFSPSGTDLGAFVTGLRNPVGIAFDSSGNFYVANSGNNTVEKFSPTGTNRIVFASTGLNSPHGIAFDRNGNLYAANSGDSTIRKYSSTGSYIGIFADNGGYSVLNQPLALAFDSGGNLYVANFNLSTIRKYAANGTDLGIFASTSQGLNNPHGLAFDSQGNLSAGNYNSTPAGYSTVVKLSGGLSSTFYSGVLTACTFIAVTDYAGRPLALPAGGAVPTTTYSLNVSATNGIVVKSPDQSTYTAGTQLTLTPSPANGYAFSGWSGNAAGNANPLTVIMDGNKNITAAFITLYQQWQLNKFGSDASNPVIAGDNANPSGDGIANLLKYAFNLNPLVPVFSGIPTEQLVTDSGQSYLTFTYLHRVGITDLVYTIGVSNDLKSWDELGTQFQQFGTPTPTGDGLTESITIRLNTPVSNPGIRSKFIRLKISRTP